MYLKIAFILLLALVNYIVWADRKNIERSGVIFARRTRAGLELLERVSSLPFWRAVYTFAIPVCVLGSLFVLLLFGLNAIYILVTPAAPAGVAPVIPGVRVPGSPIFVPFWYGILALGILMLFHEFSHGIAARTEKIKVRTSGLLLALVIPGAFVEPDQKEFAKARRVSRMRVAAAGSFANFVIAGVSVLLIFALLQNFTAPQGAVVFGVLNGTPAGGIKEVIVVKDVNGEKVSGFDDIQKAIVAIKPKEVVSLAVVELDGEYAAKNQQMNLTAAARKDDPSKGYLGIPKDGVASIEAKALLYAIPFQPIALVQMASPKFFEYKGPVLFWYLVFSLKWIAFMNFAIGIVNLLPVGGLDGGIIMKDVLERLSPRFGSAAFRGLTYLIVVFLLMNIIPYFR